MKHSFSYLFFLIIIISCQSKEELQIPEKILTKEQIIPVLVDMHIADATLISQQLDNKETKYKGENYYEMVFSKHNITRKQFDEAITFYARHPEYYEKIYDDVIAELSYMTGELSKTDSTEIPAE